MGNVTVDTTAPAYTTRHTQFKQIVQFWKPLLREYSKMSHERQVAWRAADPFLNNILRFAEKVTEMQTEDL